MVTFDTAGLPNDWGWVDYTPHNNGKDIYVLEGSYPHRGNWLCIVRRDEQFHVIRHGGSTAPPDLLCDTLEEAKAISLAIIRLVDEGRAEAPHRRI